jgi:ATP-binding cassette subfamily C protein LapB
MDANTEAQALKALFEFARGRTLVLVTHKLQLLDYVERVMVVDHGVRVADGPRDAVLAALRSGKVMKADVAPSTAPPVREAPAAKAEAAKVEKVKADHE